MSSAVITGGTSGLGRAIIEMMPKWNFCNLSRMRVDDPEVLPNERRFDCDVRFSLDDYVDEITEHSEIKVLINCAGINHLSWFEELSPPLWDDVMDTNAKAIYRTTKAFLPYLKESRGTILNIISNASHVPMTASLVYNASKAAAHMMTLQLAREFTKRYGITVFGISPAKMKDTRMSAFIDEMVPVIRGWSPEEARAYQLNSLVTGEEIDPSDVAEFIRFLLTHPQVSKNFSGCVIPYGA